jgi:hypothetical protein
VFILIFNLNELESFESLKGEYWYPRGDSNP